MNFNNYRPSLQLRIITLMTLVVLSILLIVGVSFSFIIINSVGNTVGNNALEFARFLAVMPSIQDALKSSDHSFHLKHLSEQYIKNSNGENVAIVIINQEGVRYSHPNKDLIGLHITGGDEGRSLNGEEYISTAVGISGESIRAFVPVKDLVTHEQLGVVAVGVFKQNFFETIKQNIYIVMIWLTIGLSVGIIGSFFLAKKIKGILYGFEPDEIARLFQEKKRCWKV